MYGGHATYLSIIHWVAGCVTTGPNIQPPTVGNWSVKPMGILVRINAQIIGGKTGRQMILLCRADFFYKIHKKIST